MLVLRYVLEPFQRDLVRRHAADVFAFEIDRPAGLFQETRNGPEEGGFACAVPAHHDDDLARIYLEGQIEDDVQFLVANVELLNGQQGGRCHNGDLKFGVNGRFSSSTS